MLIGYARGSKADGSQSLDLQRDALGVAGVQPDQVCLGRVAKAQRDTSVSALCAELGIERVTLYRYVGPKGDELRPHGKRVLGLTKDFRPLPQTTPYPAFAVP